MYRCLVNFTLLLVLVTLAQSAPAVHRSKRDATKVAKVTKLSVVLHNDALDEDAVPVPRTKRASPLSKLFKVRQSITNDSPLTEEQPSTLRRTRRHVEQGELDFLAQAAAGSTHHGGRRSRRSAAWWLHATIQMCDKYRHLCKSIEVKEDDVVIEIRVEDE